MAEPYQPYAPPRRGQPIPAAATPEDDDLSGPYLQDKRENEQLNAALLVLRRPQGQKAAEGAAPDEGQPFKVLGKTPGEWGRDALYGLTVEHPRALLHGARDAVQETIDLVKATGDWLNANVADLTLPEKLQVDATLPEPPEPTTSTGKGLESVYQFITGFMGAGKLIKAGGVAGAAAKGATADFAAFDEHEGNLANVWQDLGLPQSDLADYLASSPDDSVAEGRFKNALTGLVPGVAIEGLSRIGQAMRSARWARQNPAQAVTDVAQADAALPQMRAKDFAILGDVEQESLVAKRIAEQAEKVGSDPIPLLAKGQAAQSSEPEFFVNWARIDEDADVKEIWRQAVAANRQGMENAKGPRRAFADVELDAAEKDAWSVIEKANAGSLIDDAETKAARDLWAMTNRKLAEVSEVAADNPSPANLFSLRKMMAVNNVVGETIAKVRAQQARQLAAWRIASKGDALRSKEVDDALKAWGDSEVTVDIAKRLSFLFKTGDVAGAQEFAKKADKATTMDAVREVWINGLLTNPVTHEVNFVSNASMLAGQIVERATAARLSRFLGDQAAVEMGEAAANYSGMLGSFKDAARAAWRTMRTGEEDFLLPGTKLDNRKPSFVSETWGAASGSWTGRAIDALGNVIRTPTRALMAGDQFFKMMAYRGELNSLANRLVQQEVRAGKLRPDLAEGRVADILARPPQSLQLAAATEAQYRTFTDAPSKLGKGLLALKQQIPAVNIIAPFVRTPDRILNFVLERSPLTMASSHFRQEVMAGGARRNLALTKLALGSFTTMAMADMAMSGVITGKGPVDPGQRPSNWMPYSVRIGDRWYGYGRLDPVGMTMGVVADLTEVFRSDFDKRDTKTDDEIVAAVGTAIASNAMSKTYMEGLAGFFDAMADKSGSAMKRFIERTVASAVPAIVAQGERVQDPALREVRGVVDAVMARTPFLSDNLPVMRDRWGRELRWESGWGAAFDFFSPIPVRQAKIEPIDQEIVDNNWSFPNPSRVQSIEGIMVDLDRFPGSYNRLLQLRGQEIEVAGKNMLQKMNDIVTGDDALSAGYRRRLGGPDGGREVMLRGLMREYTERAKRQLLREYPDIEVEIGDKRDARKARRSTNSGLTLQ